MQAGTQQGPPQLHSSRPGRASLEFNCSNANDEQGMKAQVLLKKKSTGFNLLVLWVLCRVGLLGMQRHVQSFAGLNWARGF
jgi:hypothetical protein